MNTFAITRIGAYRMIRAAVKKAGIDPDDDPVIVDALIHLHPDNGTSAKMRRQSVVVLMTALVDVSPPQVSRRQGGWSYVIGAYACLNPAHVRNMAYEARREARGLPPRPCMESTPNKGDNDAT